MRPLIHNGAAMHINPTNIQNKNSLNAGQFIGKLFS